MTATIDDTYAEAFKSLYTEFLVTAKSRKWVRHAVDAATGNASSTILCDCEAGLDRYVDGSDTPDGRPGAIVQLHVPKFWKERLSRLERSALVRISQNVLACPTASCFNRIDGPDYFQIGRKVAYFGNGFQFRERRHNRRVWVVPILGGEFVIERRLGYAEGLMGGNLWFFGDGVDSSLAAAERAVEAVDSVPGIVCTFPGGVAGSGSKAGSKYSFSVASTYEKFCPTLQDHPDVEGGLPPGVTSVMEIIMNGRGMTEIIAATQAAITAARDQDGLIMISAGNYGGRLGESLIYLHSDKQPTVA